MVGLVIVSHSSKVAEGVYELAAQMAPDVKIAAAGGTWDGCIGTDVEKIMEAVNQVYSEEGALILFDLGSAFMNAEMAIEMLDSNMAENVEIVDVALVEGAITAAVNASVGMNRAEIKKSLSSMKLGKMP